MSKNRILLTLVAIVVSLMWATTGFAVTGHPESAAKAPSSPPPPVSDSNGPKATGDIGIQANLLISEWGSRIQDAGNRQLIVSRYTRTYITVSYVTVDVYLQRWNGASWVDVKSWSFSVSNESYVSGFGSIVVDSAGYYRARAVHYAYDGANWERLESTTAYLQVN